MKKYQHASLILLLGLFSSGFAQADGLTGKILSCVYPSSFGSGPVHTDYEFIVSPTGAPTAVRFSDFSGTSVEGYTLAGNLLVIDDPNDSQLKYDLNLSPKIKRPFKSCVYPGQGGGDAHEVCEHVSEQCVIRDAPKNI